MKTIKVFIADDEPLAREKIRRLLQRESGFEIVGEAANGKEAVEAIQQSCPDLLFLDIHMAGLDGFGVLESLQFQSLPVVIFVTAYDQYAVKAFEVHALDYLLKPFDKKRFQQTLTRVKDQLQHELRETPKYLTRLFVKSNGRMFILKVDEIDWIGAEGNYISAQAGTECYLVRESISNIEQQLDPAKFLRIHRSTIVNIERIRELQPWFHGEYRIILKDGKELMLSRTYRDKFLKALSA